MCLQQRKRIVNEEKLVYDILVPSLAIKLESNSPAIVSKFTIDDHENDVRVPFKTWCNQHLIDDTPAATLFMDKAQNSLHFPICS
jgi:hypothetical protein